MSSTEIVYVVSPDLNYQYQLFASLRSLLASGTSFDRIVIFCVGKRPKYWEFEDSRIVVEEVKNLNENYFFINKTHVCNRDAERLIFLDADTIIMKPIDSIYKNINSDLLARPVMGYPNSIWERSLVLEKWDLQKWVELLGMVGANPGTPYFNSGFFICQNGSHQKLSKIWLELYQRLLVGDPMALFKAKWSEQAAFSLAVGVAGLSYHLLDRTAHCYAFSREKELFKDAIVYHTGGRFFWNHAARIESFLAIKDLDLPKFKGSNLFNPISFHRQLRHNYFYQNLKRIYGLIKQKLKN